LVERELLTRIEHPGVIKILASFQDTDNLYFVLELCEGGNFKDLICMSPNKCNETSFRFYIAEIVNILEYLHKHGIVHRDLKVIF
jgi:3-phosphoinositide dependent protein kinase-1